MPFKSLNNKVNSTWESHQAPPGPGLAPPGPGLGPPRPWALIAILRLRLLRIGTVLVSTLKLISLVSAPSPSPSEPGVLDPTGSFQCRSALLLTVPTVQHTFTTVMFVSLKTGWKRTLANSSALYSSQLNQSLVGVNTTAYIGYVVSIFLSTPLLYTYTVNIASFPFWLRIFIHFYQCFGSVLIEYGSGSGQLNNI